VLIAVPNPASVDELGEAVHVEPAGPPLQESATVPVKPPSGRKVIS
jgi:hypothetical protein